MNEAQTQEEEEDPNLANLKQFLKYNLGLRKVKS